MPRLKVRLLALLVLLFGVGCLLKWNGYSLDAWRRHLDMTGTNRTVFFGKARWVRADDWLNDLPLVLAQVRHRPPFPEINEKIGLGQKMLAPFKLPVWGPVALFQPSLWGFFITGPDRGLSWMWLFLVFALLYAYFLLFHKLSGDFSIAFLAAVCLVYSPLFQFWSLHKAEIPIHGAFAALAFWLWMTSDRPGIILAASLWLGYSTSAFLLHQIYPAYHVTVGYFFLALTLALWADGRLHFSLRFAGWRIVGAILAVLLFSFALRAFLTHAKDIITLLRETEYPGKRFSTGGQFSFFQIFNSNLLVAAQVKNWGYLGNVCESATVFYTFPIVLGAVLVSWFHRKEALSRFVLIMTLFLVTLIFYMVEGFPAGLAKLTQLSRVPSNRVPLALGLADTSLLVWFLSQRDLRDRLPNYARFLLPLVWGGFLLGYGWRVHRWIPELRLWFLAGAVALNVGLAWLLLRARRPRTFLLALAAVSLLYTGYFNPIAFGGVAPLINNRLAQRMLEIDAHLGGKSRWATFVPAADADPTSARVLSNFPRLLGLASLDGVHSYPQFPLWRHFDPSGVFYRIYNQAGFILFFPQETGSARFSSPMNSMVYVSVRPWDPVFREVGVTHILIPGSSWPGYEQRKELEKIYCGSDACIFALKSF